MPVEHDGGAIWKENLLCARKLLAGCAYEKGFASFFLPVLLLVPSLSLVIPRRFDVRWSLLGRALRRLTGDRLRAEAWQLVGLTGGALVWLMGVYLAGALTVSPLWTSGVLAGAGLALLLGGVVGVRPQAVVTCDARVVHVTRGRERARLPLTRLEQAETISARTYHRCYRRHAAVRPFLGVPDASVLLLREQDGTALALGLRPKQCETLLRRLRQQRGGPSAAPAAAPPSSLVGSPP